MSSTSTSTALVVGGTGPTGPDVVGGLLDRGFDTTIFHTGQHEVPLPGHVKHLHGDPHFSDSIADVLGRTEYDVVVVQYGRLRHLTQHLRHRAGHVVAIGASMAPLATAKDSRWGELGRPGIVREQDWHLQQDDDEVGGLGPRIARAAHEFLAAGEAGDFQTTYIAYPSLFGPRQSGASEWAGVRRLLDGRRSLVLPDGGRRLESRGFVHNVSQAPLLALDQRAESAGRCYVVTDRDVYTMRQRVELIARHLGVEVDLVDMPFDLATPAHPLYRIGPSHRVMQGEAIRDELGYQDRYPPAEALALTVDWLSGADPAVTAEIEQQLGDPFDYAFEDQLVAWWRHQTEHWPGRYRPAYRYAHVYRHPTEPGQGWGRA